MGTKTKEFITSKETFVVQICAWKDLYSTLIQTSPLHNSLFPFYSNHKYVWVILTLSGCPENLRLYWLMVSTSLCRSGDLDCCSASEKHRSKIVTCHNITKPKPVFTSRNSTNSNKSLLSKTLQVRNVFHLSHQQEEQKHKSSTTIFQSKKTCFNCHNRNSEICVSPPDK